MTKFVFQGSGHTTGSGGPAPAVVAAIVVIGVLAYGAAKSAGRTLGDLLVIVPVAAVALVLGAVVTLLAVRARGHRSAAPRQQVQLWHANPQALPPRQVPAIAPAPQVVVNIDAGLLAGLLREAQRQQVPVIIPPEREELPR